MIILRLKFGWLTVDCLSAVYVAADEYAEGFALAMPAREWEYLGRAPEVYFVASAKRLAVNGEVVREIGT